MTETFQHLGGTFRVRRAALPSTLTVPEPRYCLTESVNGGAFVRCDRGGTETQASLATTLSKWLAARAYFYAARGYTMLYGVNEVSGYNQRTGKTVVVKVERVGE